MPILILISKMIFMKYLPPVRLKLLSKSKMLRICWNLGIFDILNIPISILMWKLIFIKYLPLFWPKLVTKLKVLRIYWNLAQLIFPILWPWFSWETLFSLNTYHLLCPNWSQIKSAQNLLKFGIFNISNMPTTILMSKMIFLNNSPSFSPKLVSKSETPRIIEIWHIWYFEYPDLVFDVKNYFC